VFPLAYAAGQRPAYQHDPDAGNHDHAARLNYSPFMEALQEQMAEDDVMALLHGYLVSGFVGKDGCITKPEHTKGLQMHAAGKAFE